VAAATRLFMNGEGLKARARLAQLADEARNDPALRAQALGTLLEICRRMQAQSCQMENTQAYVDAVTASVSEDPVRRALQALEVDYYINAHRLAIASKSTLAEAMTDKLWDVDAPGGGLIYLRRRALRADILLAGGSEEAADRAIGEVLAIAGSAVTSRLASYELATVLADMLSSLVQLGEYERANGLYAVVAIQVERIQPRELLPHL